jgi:hypothetical protein
MGDWEQFGQFVEFLFRLKEIDLKQKEIGTQETIAGHTQGTAQLLLEAQKQTLETIRLTRIITWLTIALVIIGIAQIALILFKK